MKSKSCLFCLLIVIAAIFSWGLNSKAALSMPKERIFLFEEKISLKDTSAEPAALRLWIPYPISDNSQSISDFEIISPFESSLISDKEYGNKIIYLKAGQGPAIKNTSPITVSFKVRRKELGPSSKLFLFERNLSRFLKADRLVPVNGEIKRLAEKITQGRGNDLEKVRAIYDYLIEELTYSKDDPKVCGIGDSLLTLEHKKGICTDYHSLFISLVRSLGIPAKFEIGFRIPGEAQEGKLNGYHCWAKFYLKDKGWIPVDISEADKHPEKKEYFFGHIDENRLRLTTGRDIRLKYAADAEPLNFFVYPYAEINGKRFYDIETSISFKEEKGGG